MVLKPITDTLASGVEVELLTPYTSANAAGVTALAVASAISCVSVIFLLGIITISSMSTFQAPGKLMFIRTHVAAYFVSLLFSDLVQGLGSLLSIRWVNQMAVEYGVPCTAQGAIKNGGNVASAIWSLIIAIHTFFVLFLGKRPWDPALYATLLGGWSLVGLIVILGPAAIESPDRGPYFGISGLWCWITDGYFTEKLMLEYLWMFSAAFFSFALYMLVFLKLRGNIIVYGSRIRFRRRAPKKAGWDAETGQGSLEAQLTTISKQMMLYPVAYTIIILPIAACRYASWAGHDVPFAATIFSDVIFLLSGFVNTVLFVTTRRVLPQDFWLFFNCLRARRAPATPASTAPPSQSFPAEEDMEKAPLTPVAPPLPQKEQIVTVDSHYTQMSALRSAYSPALDRGSMHVRNGAVESFDSSTPLAMPGNRF